MRKATLALLAMVTGCAGSRPGPEIVVPLPRRFVAVPESVTFVSEPPAPFVAWSDDAVLAQILVVAFRDGPSLAAAEGRVVEARARRRDAAWQLAPNVTGSASYSTQQVSSASTFGSAAPRRFDSYDVGASAAWEVDVFGRLRQQLKARGALMGAAVADREATRIGLTAEIASSYFAVREIQGRLQVARDNLENQRRSLELTEQQLEAGRGTAFDVQRARAQFAATSATVPGLEAEAAAVSAAVAALAGQPPGAFDGLLAEKGALPMPPPELIGGTPAGLIARRPDVQRAEREWAAASASVRAASAGLWPRLSLGAEIGSTSLEGDRLFGARNGRYAVGPVLSWPVLSLGRLFADRDAASGVRRQAEAAYRATILFSLQEAEAALQRYKGARAALGFLQASADASAEATSLATLRYREGVTDFLQVLDAQRTQLEAEDRLVRGRGDAARALVEVYRSLAGEDTDSRGDNP